MILLTMPEGPQLRYQNGFFEAHDLNPEVKLRWRMSRTELLTLAWRCWLAAMKGE